MPVPNRGSGMPEPYKYKIPPCHSQLDYGSRIQSLRGDLSPWQSHPFEPLLVLDTESSIIVLSSLQAVPL